MSIYEYGNREVRCLDIEVPAWIDQDITTHDVAAIMEGGCASGAYMPAVTYHIAQAIMCSNGADVFQYIEDSLGEIPQPEQISTWSALAVFFLSTAVELWVSAVEGEILENLED